MRGRRRINYSWTTGGMGCQDERLWHRFKDGDRYHPSKESGIWSRNCGLEQANTELKCSKTTENLENLHIMCKRATPDQMLKYKLALCHFKLYNTNFNSIEFALVYNHITHVCKKWCNCKIKLQKKKTW